MANNLDISYGPNPRHKLDLFLNSRASHDTIIIFWPGGAWNSGDKQQYKFAGKTLARWGFTTIIPNYRLYPEVRFPKFLDDAELAVKWAQERYKPHNIILMGHSAGAYIAAMVALNSSLPVIKGCVGISGPYDFTPRPDLKAIFEQSQPAQWKPVNRVNHPTVPFLIIHGGLDTLVKVSNSQALARKLRAQDTKAQVIIYPFFEHFTAMLPFAPVTSHLFGMKKRLTEFIAPAVSAAATSDSRQDR